MDRDALTELINSTLDQARAERNLTSDAALAHELKVSDLTIWRWRNLQVGKVGTILLPLVAKREAADHEIAQPA